MSFGGSKGGGTTITKTEPWSEQKKYLLPSFQAAGSLFNGWTTTDKKGNITGMTAANNALAPAYYKGNTVADQSKWTQQALQMQAKAANELVKSPLIKTATSTVNQISNGKALKNNAGLNQLNALAAKAPVTAKQALNGNAAMNSLNKLGNSNTLKGNAGYSTLNTLANQATGRGNAGLTVLNGYATEDFNAGNAAMRNLLGSTGTGINAGNAAMAQLNQLATNDNPYMDSLYQRANNQAQASLDSNFNRAGRYGSGAHEAAAADAANNLANEMYSNLYNQRINAANAASSAYNQGISEGINAQQAAGNLYNAGNQLAVNAANSAADAYNAALGQRINAAQNAGGLYNQDLSTRAGMLSNAGQLYNAGIGNLINAYGQRADAANSAGSLYNAGQGQRILAAATQQQLAQTPFTAAAMLSEAGGIMDDYNQQKINADIDRYNYNAQRALQALANYNSLIQGSFGGTSTATGQQARGSTVGNVVGGALTGGGLGAALSGLSGTAALTSPWALGGAALGSMLGLF